MHEEGYYEKPEYLGVPVLTGVDYDLLMLAEDFDEADIDEPYSLTMRTGRAITDMPSNAYYIDFDTRTLLVSDQYTDLDDDELNEFTEQVNEGYAAVFGVMALVSYFRSGGDDLRNHLQCLPSRSGIFPHSKDEITNIIRVRSGQITSELESENYDVDAAYELCGDIFYENPLLDSIVTDIEEDKNKSSFYRGESLGVFEAGHEGFYHGVQQSLRLLVSTHELRVFSAGFDSQGK